MDHIFHLESFRDRLDDSSLEKHYFTFLIDLARAQLYAGEGPALEKDEFVETLRQDFLSICALHRCAPAHSGLMSMTI